MLNRYQTTPWTTLLFFTATALSFAYGVFRVIRRHDRGGYFEAAVCVIVFYTFNKNYRRPTAPVKTGQE